MRLTLTKDSGELIDVWTLEDDPEVFDAVAKATWTGSAEIIRKALDKGAAVVEYETP